MLDTLNRLFDASVKAAAVFRRAFDAAGGGPRSSTFGTLVMPGRIASASSATIAARANALGANSPIAETIASVWATNLIGDGPSARSQHPNRAMRRALESAWRRFYARCDVDGFDLCGLLYRVVRSLVIAGEALVLMTATPRGELQLRLLSPEQLDRSKSFQNANGGTTDLGIERNAAGVVTGYWIFPTQPQALDVMLRPSVRIDAADVLHLHDPKWPGQARGVSWLTPVMTLIAQLDRLIDSLVERARVSALFAGFVTDPSGSSGFGEGQKDPQELSLEPGIIRLLPPDATINFPSLPDAGAAIDLIRSVLRQIGVGVGIPYELLAGDLSQVNYSSAKAGFSQFYRRCRALRASLLVARLLEPIWQRFVTLEILSGRLQAADFADLPEDYFAVTFTWPAWESLQPLDETKADVLALNAGLISRQRLIEQRGFDAEEIDAELAADNFVPKITAGSAGSASANLESTANA